MKVAELKSILSIVGDEKEVRMLSLRGDNLNESFDIESVVETKVYKGSEYEDMLVLIPE